MPVGLSFRSANRILDEHFTSPEYPWMQLHTGDPGATGVNNVAGNTTRQDTSSSWGDAVAGAKRNNAVISWSDAEVDTSETYTHVSFWSADSGGECGSTGAISAMSINAEDESFRIPVGGYNVSMGTTSN